MRLKSIVKQPVNNGVFVVFSSAGSSYFTKPAASEIGLKHNMCFDLLQDETNEADYYLKVVQPGNGLRVKCYAGTKNTFQFHARGLAKKLARQFCVSHKYVKVQLGTAFKLQNEMVYPLITSSIKTLNA